SDVLASVGIERAQESHVERARGTETGSGGNVGHADDLDLRLDLLEPQCLAHDRMLHPVGAIDHLHLRILDDVVALERRVKGNINVSIHRCRDHHPAVARIIGGQIGAPATDADSKRCACDDHVEVRTSSNTQGSSRGNRTVSLTASRMLTVGAHRVVLNLLHSRKMKGLSPTHPRSPPPYVRRGFTSSSSQMTSRDSSTVTYSSVPAL